MNGTIDPEIVYEVKNHPCFQNGTIDQKSFINAAIIYKSPWAKLFYQCLNIIDTDETDTEEDRQIVRLLIMAYILDLVKFVENTVMEIQEKVEIGGQLINEGFHFVMRCFFNEDADPQISHETTDIIFSKFSTTTPC